MSIPATAPSKSVAALAAGIFLLSGAAAPALTCMETAAASFNACTKPGEAAFARGGGDLSYLSRCAAQYAQAQAGCSGAAGAQSQICREAQTNIRWVLLEDAGAQRTYAQGVRNGLSSLDAVIGAEAHNAHAQQTIRQCVSSGRMVAEALGGHVAAGNGEGAPQPLTSQACGCVSVLPTAARTYRVTNRCGAMDVYLDFRASESALGDNLPISQSVYAGHLGGAHPSGDVVVPASWTIVSLVRFEVRNTVSGMVCPR